MYNFDGTVKNCIRNPVPIGNLKDNSITEILHGEKNCLTKHNMTYNKPGPTCNVCYDLEKNTNSFDVISDRIFYLKELKDVNFNIYKSIDTHELHTIDIRWSNLCNFACVYCSADFSSKWADELNVRLDTPSDKQATEFQEYIYRHAKNLKHVYLAGGEPLLMKENLQLLQELNPDVNLRINTNLSKVDTGVFDAVCKFKNVHWTVSVETVQEEFEYIRFGGRWPDFLDNLNTIRKLEHKISFNMLWFLLNYDTVFGCVDYLKGLGFHNNSFIIGA
jgi:MoaA/NifB/PqqE/SkfB family radical SAM enzyme